MKRFARNGQLVSQDVTEIHRAHQLVVASQAQYRLLFDTAAVFFG